MLRTSRLSVNYGKVIAAEQVTLHVSSGEVVALVGSNGAGKSSILSAIMGLVPSQGEVTIDGVAMDRQDTHRRVETGVALSPEGRHVFPEMTVFENLQLGFVPRNDVKFENLVAEMIEIFPRLGERTKQMAGRMSGGEQQMLAIARALMSSPKVLLLDEPTLGLAPIIVNQLSEVLGILSKRGLAILLAEQNAEMALRASRRGYVVENGRIVRESASAELLQADEIRAAYLGM